MQVDSLDEKAADCLRPIFIENGLAWDNDILKSLSGDLHTRVLGAFLSKILHENGILADFEYETVMKPTGCRSDILINKKVDLESKAQGTFGSSTSERWVRLENETPELIHVLISWRHNSSTLQTIRKTIPEEFHFYFHNLSTRQNQPNELERLVKSLILWFSSKKQ